MKIVVALGGNALLRRGEPMTPAAQRSNVQLAARLLAQVAREHRLIISHGNGPQVGLLALQGASEPWPLDVLGAETQGMIGYLLEQELGNALPPGAALATLLTMVEVDADDPAFADPTKFVGPLCDADEAHRLAAGHGWTFRLDGDRWRRVVPSPRPRRICEIRPVQWLLEHDAIVICAGGGGIPTIREHGDGHRLAGVEAVIDKDLCSGLLARELSAERLVMLTDVPGVYLDWGGPAQRLIRRAAPAALRALHFAAGSMGPKVEAACEFAERTGRVAVIGGLPELPEVLSGSRGTTIDPACEGIAFA